MAVRGAGRLAGAAAVALLVALSGPAVGAQEAPATTGPAATPAEPTEAPAAPAAPAAPSVRDALTGTSEAVTGTAAGGFAGGDTLDVVLTLENHTDRAVELAVPRGALFETDDETEQTAVTVGPTGEDAAAVAAGVDPTITVQPGEHTFELTGFCAQHLDSGPNDVVPMTWAGVAAEPLATVVTNIAATQPDTTTAQHAVWWVTDVPVVPVPDEVAPLLEGVDTEAFAANPKRVTQDERYTPAWGRDQALDADDPFGETPFAPDGSGSSGFSSDDGSGGGPSFGFLMVGVLVAMCVVGVLLVRAGTRQPAAATASTRTTGGATPAGWHPDPGVPGQLRWWDGSRWTSDVRPR